MIFGPTETERTVSVAITDDSILEATEDFFGILSLPSDESIGGVSIGDNSMARAEIEDNDGEIETA